MAKKQPEIIEVPIRNVTRNGFPRLRENLDPFKEITKEIKSKQMNRVSLISGANKNKYKGNKK